MEVLEYLTGCCSQTKKWLATASNTNATASNNQNKRDHSTAGPQWPWLVSSPLFNGVAQPRNHLTHGHYWMGAPAGIAD